MFGIRNIRLSFMCVSDTVTKFYKLKAKLLIIFYYLSISKHALVLHYINFYFNIDFVFMLIYLLDRHIYLHIHTQTKNQTHWKI